MALDDGSTPGDETSAKRKKNNTRTQSSARSKFGGTHPRQQIHDDAINVVS